VLTNKYCLHLLQGDRYSLLVLVPNSRSGLSQLISDLSGYSLKNVQKHLQIQEVEVCLPCFQIQTTTKPIESLKKVRILVFKFSPCCSIDKLSSGYFSGVWVLKADVSELCVGSIFNRWCSVYTHFTTCWRWNRKRVPKRRLLILRRRGNTQKTIYQGTYCNFDQNTGNCPFSQIKI
jgi:hypothetical protein